MSDSKAQSLTKRVINSLAAITGVRLWSGKDGDPNDERAQGVELSELVNSNVVEEGSTIDYQGLTPKGFALSVATEARKGIVKYATPAQVDTGEAGLVVSAADVKRKYDEAIAMSGIKLRLRCIVSSTGLITKYNGDLSASAIRQQTGEYKITHNLNSVNYIVNAHTLRGDTTRNQAKIAGLYRNKDYFIVDISDDNSANDSSFEFTIFSIL